MLKKLQLQRDIVAIEAFSVHDVTGFMKGIFPAIKEDFIGFTKLFTPHDKPVGLLPEFRNFEHEISKHTYLDIKELGAYVPEGMDVSYREYADYLLPATKHVMGVMQTLSEFSVYLARLVSSNELHLSTGDLAAKYRGLEEARKLINEDLGKCFAKGSTRTDVSIGKVVARNAEWPDLFNMAEDMTKNVFSIDRPKLIKLIHETSELMEAVERKIKAAEMDGVSPNVVQNIADGAYQVASELEFFAVTYYKVEVFVTCLNRTVEHFKTVMKQ